MAKADPAKKELATPEEDVEVRATSVGYVGGELRSAGQRFMWPAGVPLGSWVKPVAFGGKGDHDGDGLTGGSKPADDGDGKPKGKGKGKGKAETVDAPTAEPFADAPAPIRVENEINAATGGTEPDWIAPAGGDTPVPADD